MEWVVIALLVLVALLALVRVSMRRPPAMTDAGESLAPEERSIYRRLMRRQREIDEAAKALEGGAFAPISTQARESSREIVTRLGGALGQRQAVRRALLNRSTFEVEVGKLKEQLAAASTDPERESLSGAIQARAIELDHYQSLADALKRIDALITEAESSLTETKARLLSVKSRAAGQELDIDGLRANLSHLVALRSTVDEVQVSLQ